MLWWLLLGLGGLWAADRALSGGASSSSSSSGDIQRAVSIALAKETKVSNLTDFANKLQPVNAALANQLVARAQFLSTPSKSTVAALATAQTSTDFSQAQFAVKR